MSRKPGRKSGGRAIGCNLENRCVLDAAGIVCRSVEKNIAAAGEGQAARMVEVGEKGALRAGRGVFVEEPSAGCAPTVNGSEQVVGVCKRGGGGSWG